MDLGVCPRGFNAHRVQHAQLCDFWNQPGAPPRHPPVLSHAVLLTPETQYRKPGPWFDQYRKAGVWCLSLECAGILDTSSSSLFPRTHPSLTRLQVPESDLHVRHGARLPLLRSRLRWKILLPVSSAPSHSLSPGQRLPEKEKKKLGKNAKSGMCLSIMGMGMQVPAMVWRVCGRLLGRHLRPHHC
eukprot:1265728-Rhodomonas_salina.5